VATVDDRRSVDARSVPFAMDDSLRVPRQRSFDRWGGEVTFRAR
jgi:hypothetical protein